MTTRTFTSLAEAAAFLATQEGQALHLNVLHDATCLHGTAAGCTCSPHYAIEDLTAEAYERGAAAEREWRNRHKGN